VGPTVLHNLIAKKKIQSLVVVFVKHEPLTRNKDLACSEAFANCLVKELVPWVRAEYRVSEEPARTIVGGLSLDGLMASYCGLRHADVFGKVLSQSGSYWYYPGGLEQKDLGLPVAEPGGLTREYLTAPRREVRFYVEVGCFEQGGSFTNAVAETHRFRDVLKAKGYTMQFSEFIGGHEYVCWRGSFADALMALAGVRAGR
jgi:enterochelin esterase family protein